MTKVPCPFVYSDNKKCTGHIVRIEAYRADLIWTFQEDGTWNFDYDNMRSHYHLFCSEKGNHSGMRGRDNEQMKRWSNQLPDDLKQVVQRAG